MYIGAQAPGLLLQVHCLGAGLEVEHLGLEQVSIGDAVVTESGSIY